MLLANNDRRTNNLVQSLVLDVCYNQAAVNCVQTARVDELLTQGCRGGYDLILVNPDNLAPEPSRKGSRVKAEETVRVLREIKRRQTVPIIALAVRAEDDWALQNAGADSVLGLPFGTEPLRQEVRRLLRMSQTVEEPEAPRSSLFGWLVRLLNFKPALQVTSDE